MAFVDLDDLTLKSLGALTVGSAWAVQGEAAFRRAEVAALHQALAGTDQVLSLGGGTPTAPGAAELIEAARQKRAAQVIYLRAQPATLRARLIGQVHDRPSLTGADPLDEIETVFAQRDPAYLALADTVIDADRLRVEQVAEIVMNGRRANEP
jgi:shikimate kinase